MTSQPPLRIIFIFAAITIGMIATCEATADSPVRRVELPAQPHEYTKIPWPKHFRNHIARLDNTPDDNPITNAGATLGRVLFYDKSLSANHTTSCASCHQQEHAFTDPDKRSIGHKGEAVARNSMSLINSRFYQRGRFFWDERARTLEQQVVMPIEDSIEMGHDLNHLEEQLSGDPIYPPLFTDAFGESKVTQERIAKALAQFVRSIVSYRSKYDIGREQVRSIRSDFPNFSDEENRGKQIFLGQGRCANCHLSHGLPSDVASENRGGRQDAFFHMLRPVANGIDADVSGVDQGVGGFNGVDLDIGRFKSPSLRNVEVTGPYMHDGRFATIHQVVEHYNWSVKPHPNLGGGLRQAAAEGMAIPEPDKDALVAFLMTLTDHELLADPKFSNPFVKHP